ncbi:MAG TPA: tripartite tricarboxylate transporter substrate binding protein [Burkholderiales bacterium]|jgi:tripartite-type tricarboxylate transporter receptor subunit TctC|nr:tripartite tricarboxylate transporter substrate binding protein [Burkholderiales bacterium]
MKVRILALALASTLTGAAHCQDYPHKPIRLIVPFPAGGATDILARVMGQKLGDSFRQQVVVDNRPGAGGTIGSRLAADSSADGYTLIMGTTSTHAIGPSLYSKRPYDPLKDFTAITEVVTSPNVLLVSAVLPVNSVKELIDLAKSKPGQLNFGSSGIGTQFHLSGELLKLLAGINIVHVPYKGTALAYPDLFSGQIAILFDVPPVALPHIKSGRIRALGVSGNRRAEVLPDVPTIIEAGVSGYDADLWYGLWGPAELPRDKVKLLHGEVVKLLQNADAKRRFADMGADPVGSTPEAFTAFIKTEIAKWKKVVIASGARAD